jgi:WD40 repeat protein
VHGLHLIDSDTGKIAWSDLRAHHGVVYQLRWALNDSWLLSASADGSVKVWDTAGIVGAATNNTKTPHYMVLLLWLLLLWLVVTNL